MVSSETTSDLLRRPGLTKQAEDLDPQPRSRLEPQIALSLSVAVSTSLGLIRPIAPAAITSFDLPPNRAAMTAQPLPDLTIRFATFPHSWIYLRDIGELPRAIAPIDPGVPLWYVVQNRPGALSAWDRALIGRARTAYAASKLGVPLVWVFRHEDLERAIREAAR